MVAIPAKCLFRSRGHCAATRVPAFSGRVAPSATTFRTTGQDVIVFEQEG